MDGSVFASAGTYISTLSQGGGLHSPIIAWVMVSWAAFIAAFIGP